MKISSILNSPSQKRIFLFTSLFVLAVSIIGIFLIATLVPSTPLWGTFSNLLTSVVASGAFALMSALFLTYFFVDPDDIAKKSAVLPQDIEKALVQIASSANEYTIFARTGRHFRAEILPILVRRARSSRRKMRIRAVLLDLRDVSICTRYANFRRNSSFDKYLWSAEYVRTEVLSTVLALIQASQENPDLIEIELFLSARLSTFRIEGTADELLVTREDPKDHAMRYRKADRDYSAFSTELDWICAEAFRVRNQEDGTFPSGITSIFDDGQITALEPVAKSNLSNASPYAR